MKTSGFCLATAIFAIVLSIVPVRADEPPAVLTTTEEAAEYIGKTAAVEFTVVAVKHSHRRKILFITSTDNPRSPSGLLAMIGEADLPAFEAKSREDLAKRLVGKRIRAQGEIVRDEGQLFVRLTSARQIAVIGPAVVALAAGDIVFTNEEGKERSLTEKELSKLPRADVEIERDGKKETFSGISVASLLQHAGIVLGHEARDRRLTRYVLVTSADGYQALLSIGEVDPHLRKPNVLLADKMNGRPVEPSDGPWRLVIPDDLRRRRWVRSVARIDVRYADVVRSTVKP